MKVAGVTLKSYILKLRPSLPTSPKSNNQVHIRTCKQKYDNSNKQ